jgi:hypothetical protein
MFRELRRFAALISMGALCFVFAGTARAVTVSLDSDQMPLVDGKRVFLLGLYENPQDDAVLKQAAEAGVMLVNIAPEPAQLDRLHNFGLYGWVNTGGDIDFSDDKQNREEALRKKVADFAGHPAFFTWEVPDEALWNCWWTPKCWRSGEEPRLQREKMAALTDAVLKEELLKERAEADRLFEMAEYDASEEIADGIWKKLGAESPHPEMNVSQSYEKSIKLCEGMREGYALLKQLDPKHPIWMNHAPRNSMEDLTRFATAADVVGCDIYPVPPYLGGHSDLPDRSLTAVGEYTDRMQKSAPGKPVWMVLQAFGWVDLGKDLSEEAKRRGRRPTYIETRFMAYDAIAHGARGILYWGSMCIEKDSQLWTDLLKVTRELADLQPVLSAKDLPVQPEVKVGPSWGSGAAGVRVLAKQAGDGGVVYIIVNENGDQLNYSLERVTAPNGAKFSDALDGRDFTVVDGALKGSINSYGVQILRLRTGS